MRRFLAMAAVLVGTVALSSPAQADIVVGAGLSGNAGVGGGDVTLPSSYGVYGLVGYRLGLGALELQPELELNYLSSISSLRNDEIDWAFQVMGGGRAGLDLGGWVPSAYVHFGLGTVTVPAVDGLPSHTETAPSVEVGGALDYRLADLLSVGAQLGVSGVRLSNVVGKDAENVSWVRAGIHASLAF